MVLNTDFAHKEILVPLYIVCITLEIVSLKSS